VIETFAVEDGVNIHTILCHHLGIPRAVDDDGARLGAVEREDFEALERDLLRYCTRLRSQPRTDAHYDRHRRWVPEHGLIGKHK
jgi:hypothetical protein